MTKFHGKAFITGILLCLAIFTGDACAGDNEVDSDPSGVYTPARGSQERKAILDAMRREFSSHLGLEVIFVVRHLKVKDGWAWVHTWPQSPDGTQKYEDLLALLNFRDHEWQVVEIPCTEVENPDCIDSQTYFSRLRERFPGVPGEIFAR